LYNRKRMKSMIYRSSILLVIIAGFFTFNHFKKDTSNPEREALILNSILQFVKQVHFEPKELDDKFSEFVFTQFLERLDPGKRYFTLEDISVLEAHKFSIDDQVKASSFEFFDLANSIVSNRIKQSKEFYDELIQLDYKLETEEYIELDEDKRNFEANDAALKDYWRRLIKYEILNRVHRKKDAKSSEDDDDYEGEEEEIEIDNDLESDESDESLTLDEKIEKSKSEIQETYDRWFKRMLGLKRSHRFEAYVSSVANYFDPHTDYFSPKEKEDFDINMGGKIQGIGARLQQDGDYIKVVSIVPGGPAWKGKELEENDLIMKVAQKGEDPVDITGMFVDEVVQLIRGKEGTVVILTVKKQDGLIQNIEIEREEVILDESFARSLIIDIPGVIENVAYIRLPKFYSSFESDKGNSCAVDVAKEIEKLNRENINGVILDLRNNSGGSLTDVVTMSGLFIEDGPIVQVKSRNAAPYVHRDTDKNVQYSGPLIVMINNFSASASEILAAAMQDYGRAIIVGSQTFGKGSVQRFYDLDQGVRGFNEHKPLGSIKMTTQKFYRVNGGSTQLEGVMPDIVFPHNYMFIKTGESEYNNAMPWSEIAAKPYSQNVVKIEHLEKIKSESIKRMEVNPTFVKVEENARRLKNIRDFSKYPLSLEAYQQIIDNRRLESKNFDGVFSAKIDNIQPRNLDADMDYINMDESRVGRNEDWMNGIKKDFYLYETIHIMRDMILSESSFAALAKNVNTKQSN
jgi:carboxyl-terminal processing protease